MPVQVYMLQMQKCPSVPQQCSGSSSAYSTIQNQASHSELESKCYSCTIESIQTLVNNEPVRENTHTFGSCTTSPAGVSTYTLCTRKSSVTHSTKSCADIFPPTSSCQAFSDCSHVLYFAKLSFLITTEL